MQEVILTHGQLPVIGWTAKKWTQFQIFPACVDPLSQSQHQRITFFGMADQGLAVVREGKRHEPISCKPTSDLAKDESIFERRSRRTVRQHDGHISVARI